jgi:hypothetical protein
MDEQAKLQDKQVKPILFNKLSPMMEIDKGKANRNAHY